jgi:hypothetical protein
MDSLLGDDLSHALFKHSDAASRISPYPTQEGIRAPASTADKAKQERLRCNLRPLVEACQKVGRTSRKWDEPAKRALIEFARTRSGVTDTNEPW